MVEQEVCIKDEDKDCTSEVLLEDLPVVLSIVVEETEDNYGMLIQNYSGLEMQEYTELLYGLIGTLWIDDFCTPLPLDCVTCSLGMLTGHAFLSTCQLHAKGDDVGLSDLPAS